MNETAKPPIKDHIIVEANGDLWVSIKDASDLLGCSERNVWRIAKTNKWQHKKEKSSNKRKTFLLRKDVEKFHKQEQERTALKPLGSPDNPANPDGNVLSDTSDKGLPDNGHKSVNTNMALSGIMSDMDLTKPVPIIVRDFQQIILKLHENKEAIAKRVVFWQTSTFWLASLSVLVCGLLLFYLSDKTKVLAQKEKALNESYASVSLLNNTVGTLSDKMTTMSGQLKTVSDKFGVTQQDLTNAQALLKKKGINFEKTSLEPVSDDASRPKP